MWPELPHESIVDDIAAHCIGRLHIDRRVGPRRPKRFALAFGNKKALGFKVPHFVQRHPRLIGSLRRFGHGDIVPVASLGGFVELDAADDLPPYHPGLAQVGPDKSRSGDGWIEMKLKSYDIPPESNDVTAGGGCLLDLNVLVFLGCHERSDAGFKESSTDVTDA